VKIRYLFALFALFAVSFASVACATTEPAVNSRVLPENERGLFLSNSVYFPIHDTEKIEETIEKANTWLNENQHRIYNFSVVVINATTKTKFDQAWTVPSGIAIFYIPIPQ